MYKRASPWEAQPVLCGDLEGGMQEGAGKEAQEGGDICNIYI